MTNFVLSLSAVAKSKFLTAHKGAALLQVLHVPATIRQQFPCYPSKESSAPACAAALLGYAEVLTTKFGLGAVDLRALKVPPINASHMHPIGSKVQLLLGGHKHGGGPLEPPTSPRPAAWALLKEGTKCLDFHTQGNATATTTTVLGYLQRLDYRTAHYKVKVVLNGKVVQCWVPCEAVQSFVLPEVPRKMRQKKKGWSWKARLVLAAAAIWALMYCWKAAKVVRRSKVD